MTDRMQFTDLGSYQRIWRWMGECGDTHQQAGEVIFSTPNMHWPGQVARPGDWIVRTPTGFVAEPAGPECICPDDPTDLEGPRCPVHEVEQLKAELSTTEAALAESRGEGMPTQAETLDFVRERWPDRVAPIWRAAKCAEEAGECLGALNKPWLTDADLEKETAQLGICVMALAESAGFNLRRAIADEWNRALKRTWPQEAPHEST